MSGINLMTLVAAHEALMRAWRAPVTGPLPYPIQAACMAAGVALKCELEALGLQVEVKPTEPEKVDA